MSINDIYDAIEYQEVWATWNGATIDNLAADRERARKQAELLKGVRA